VGRRAKREKLLRNLKSLTPRGRRFHGVLVQTGRKFSDGMSNAFIPRRTRKKGDIQFLDRPECTLPRELARKKKRCANTGVKGTEPRKRGRKGRSRMPGKKKRSIGPTKWLCARSLRKKQRRKKREVGAIPGERCCLAHQRTKKNYQKKGGQRMAPRGAARLSLPDKKETKKKGKGGWHNQWPEWK